MKLNVKVLYLKHHKCFIKKYNDKLIQENVKVFKEKLGRLPNKGISAQLIKPQK